MICLQHINQEIAGPTWITRNIMSRQKQRLNLSLRYTSRKYVLVGLSFWLIIKLKKNSTYWNFLHEFNLALKFVVYLFQQISTKGCILVLWYNITFQVGLEPFRGVSILGFNSKEWFLSNLGAIFAGWVVVVKASMDVTYLYWHHYIIFYKIILLYKPAHY